MNSDSNTSVSMLTFVFCFVVSSFLKVVSMRMQVNIAMNERNIGYMRRSVGIRSNIIRSKNSNPVSPKIKAMAKSIPRKMSPIQISMFLIVPIIFLIFTMSPILYSNQFLWFCYYFTTFLAFSNF